MRIVNTDYISGKNLETIGLVQGTMVQSKHIGRDFAASFKGLVGGESIVQGAAEVIAYGTAVKFI